MMLLSIVLPLLPTATVLSEEANQSFSVRAADISGHGGGAISLAGGGAYNLNTEPKFLHAAGSFKCTGTVVDGPLKGCQAGTNGRWHGWQLLTESNFRCVGQASGEPQDKVFTDDKTVAMQASFYLQGERADQPVTVRMWVSQVDQSDYNVGTQNVWVQGVGCGNAITNFN